MKYRRQFIMVPFVLALLCSGRKHPGVNAPAPEISATVFEPDGVTGAKNALIKIFDACDTGGEPVFVTITDDSGRFAVDELDDGFYNFWAERESLVLFQDSVPVAAMQSTLRSDTLEKPSTLTGAVGLQEYHDPRSVTVSIVGFDKPAITPDARGVFTLTGLAGGRWSLLFRSTIPEYLPTIVPVSVDTSSNDTLTDTIRLHYTGIPVVSGIIFTQDTLAGTIRLSWAKPEYKMVRDYLVYRDSCTTTGFAKAPAFITEDTCYLDSIRMPPVIDARDTLEQCLSYRIAIRNTVQEIGATGPRIEVSIAPRAFGATFLDHQVRYPKDSTESALKGDTVLIVLSAKSRTRSVRSLYWYDPAKKDTVKTVIAPDSMTRELIDTLRYAFDSIGTRRLLAVATDNAGTRWTDTAEVVITADELTAFAGEDTAVLSCDTVRFHGEVRRKIGSGGKYSWKFGDGPWTALSGSDTAVAASSLASTNSMVVCSLAVSDNNGNRAFDKIRVKVTVIPLPLTQRIIAGGFHNLFLDADGNMSGTGINDNGQLGHISEAAWLRLSPIMAGVRSMDAGDHHSFIIKIDGSLWACGLNDHGQLGDGTVTARLQPVRIADNIKSVTAGAAHSLLLSESGILYACGANGSGQLGDSTTTDNPQPRAIMTDVRDVAAGGAHSLILKSDGTLLACGSNTYGQLGDGTTVNRPLPVQVMSDVRAVKAGGYHSLILKTDGSLWACGWNYAGQLGDGTTENRSTPVRIMSGIADIAAGDLHTLLLTDDCSLLACGENGMGQLGDGTNSDRLLPVKIMTGVRGIDAGKWHSLILQRSGAVWICGWTSYNADTYGGTGINWQAGSGRLIPEEW